MSSGPPDPPEFLVDRSLGTVIVPKAIGELGYVVHTLDSIYGVEEAKYLDDTVWLRDAGKKGWLCLMKDKITRRPANRPAVCDNHVKAFCLTSGNMTGEQNAERLVYNINRIVQSGRRPGPFLYAVHARTIHRLCPPTGRVTRRQAKLLSRG
jgi:PIN like domain